MKLFDGYIAVDWSANSKPKRGKDSIWIAASGWRQADGPINMSTRTKAIQYIELLLRKASCAGRRLLCTFDFPFGYPHGTAVMMTGKSGWESIWSRIEEVIKDDSENRNNRFDAAAELNAAFDGEGPFWGNGLSRDIFELPRKKPSGWGVNLPPNLRYAEKRVRSAQEVWKLSGQGCVGSQALTGIAALQKLRQKVNVQVWPFETLGRGYTHVLAEIYPSLVEPHHHAVKDAGQVMAIAAALQALDQRGHLSGHLNYAYRLPAAVREEEALFLGMDDAEKFKLAAKLAPAEDVVDSLKLATVESKGTAS